MLEFFSLVLGEDPQRVRRYQPSGRRRIVMMGSALLVPVLLWLVATFLLVYQVLNESIEVAIIAALIASFLIFLIERAIIMSPSRHWVMATFRVALGFLVALMGSLSIDEVIFKNDIDTRVAEMKQQVSKGKEEAVLNGHRPEHTAKEGLVQDKYQAWQLALEEVRKEADGTGGSGVAKVGHIARLKQQHADRLEKDYHLAQAELAAFDQRISGEAATAAATATASFNEHGLLLRVRALFELVMEDGFLMFFYLVITLLLFCLEFIVIVLKWTLPPTTDEQLELLGETLHLDRAQRTADKIRNHHSASFDIAREHQARHFAAQALRPVL